MGRIIKVEQYEEGSALKTTTTIDWDWLNEPSNNESVKPIRESTTTVFADDTGVCFKTTGAEVNSITTGSYLRTDWAQRRSTSHAVAYSSLPNSSVGILVL